MTARLLVVHPEQRTGRTVRSLDAPDALGWFRDTWPRARAPLPYGLSSLFEAAVELDLPAPETLWQLDVLLSLFLYVEGGPDGIYVDPELVAVSTNDDEAAITYAFVSADRAARDADRLAFLFHTDPLPDALEAAAPFVPPPHCVPIAPAGAATGTTFFCVWPPRREDDWGPHTSEGLYSLEGVRLPELGQYLCAAEPAVDAVNQSTWPALLLMLRALVEPDAPNLTGSTLSRFAELPIASVRLLPWAERVALTASAEVARHELERWSRARPSSAPEAPELHVTDHCIHLRLHAEWAHEVLLFDDLWARAHPKLVSSLAAAFDPMRALLPLPSDAVEPGSVDDWMAQAQLAGVERRKQAFERLAAIGDERAIGVLVRRLLARAPRDAFTRQDDEYLAARDALRQLDVLDRLLPILVPALGSHDSTASARALSLLIALVPDGRAISRAAQVALVFGVDLGDRLANWDVGLPSPQDLVESLRDDPPPAELHAPLIAGVFAGDDEYLARDLFYMLCDWSSPELVPLSLRFLDGQGPLQSLGLQGLMRSDARQHAARIEAFARECRDPTLRTEAALLLAHWQVPSSSKR